MLRVPVLLGYSPLSDFGDALTIDTFRKGELEVREGILV